MKPGWESAKLKDICVVDWGNTNLTKAAYVDDGEFLAVSAAGCDGRIGHKEHAKYTPVLSAIGAQCGKMFFPEEDFTAIKNTITLTPKSDLCSSRFLYYLLNFVELPKRGAGQPFISKGDIQNFQIKYPPIPEQHRIVAILDEAFDGIATAKANAEKNLQNARALFESHLQSVFTQRGEGWVEKPIEDIAEFSQGIQVGLENQSTEMADGLVRFIRIVDYTQKTKDLRFVKDPGRRYWVKESDIVMVRYGTPGLIGRGIAGVIANNLFKISVLDEVILNDYLSFFLRKSEIQNYLASQGSSTMPALTFKQLGKVVINYPSDKNVQEKLVKKIQEMSIEVDRLELIYQQKLQSLENLKKSLLHQAFTGQL